MRIAWEKFSELEETRIKYGERAEVAIEMLQAEQQRVEVDAAVRTLRVEIDGFPARRTNLQQEVYDAWLFQCQRLTEFDHYLAQLRLRLQQLNETAMRRAELDGKRVGPLDRMGLLNELQKAYRERTTAFDSLRPVLADVAGAKA